MQSLLDMTNRERKANQIQTTVCLNDKLNKAIQAYFKKSPDKMDMQILENEVLASNFDWFKLGFMAFEGGNEQEAFRVWNTGQNTKTKIVSLKIFFSYISHTNCVRPAGFRDAIYGCRETSHVQQPESMDTSGKAI